MLVERGSGKFVRVLLEFAQNAVVTLNFRAGIAFRLLRVGLVVWQQFRQRLICFLVGSRIARWQGFGVIDDQFCDVFGMAFDIGRRKGRRENEIDKALRVLALEGRGDCFRQSCRGGCFGLFCEESLAHLVVGRECNHGPAGRDTLSPGLGGQERQMLKQGQPCRITFFGGRVTLFPSSRETSAAPSLAPMAVLILA